ncbi:hypothetical protein Cni_G29358 [Canna indica]|uniref:Reverse transcriptase domain-containing protein n=1 Tax=Canna indica TaxID=4628 RepID=A0AAQ3L4M1_9LILI|nr:hypothetical protein Cni_G29358 [Canna indica]
MYGRGKTPDSNGYSLEFYINFWEDIRKSLCGAFKDFHQQMHLPNTWGQTNLVFIPKKEQPKEIKDFRPIDLCNVAYKILSKVLVNRLKPYIKEIISWE